MSRIRNIMQKVDTHVSSLSHFNIMDIADADACQH